MALTPEGILKEACLDLMRASGWYVRVISVGVIPGRRNPSAGMADCVAIKGGRVLMIEFKTAKAHLSEVQEDFILNWNNKGGEAYVVRTLTDLSKIISKSHLSSDQNQKHQCKHCSPSP